MISIRSEYAYHLADCDHDGARCEYPDGSRQCWACWREAHANPQRPAWQDVAPEDALLLDALWDEDLAIHKAALNLLTCEDRVPDIEERRSRLRRALEVLSA